MTTETKNRFIRKNNTSANAAVSPNDTDSNDCTTGTSPFSITANASFVVAGVIQHSSPYIAVYTDGTARGTETADDFTDNAWGTYFYVGSGSNGTIQLNGIIQSVAIYSTALSAGDVGTVTKALNAREVSIIDTLSISDDIAKVLPVLMAAISDRVIIVDNEAEIISFLAAILYDEVKVREYAFRVQVPPNPFDRFIILNLTNGQVEIAVRTT